MQRRKEDAQKQRTKVMQILVVVDLWSAKLDNAYMYGVGNRRRELKTKDEETDTQKNMQIN